MKVVNGNDLSIIKKINYGAFGNIFLVEFENHIFCYKQFIELYPKDILNNIALLTNLEFSFNYITPIFLVEHNNRVVGYLSLYNKELEDLEFVNFKKNKIFYLKQTRDLIENLHTKYNRIHGDISSTNVLVDKTNKETYLIDFDSSLYLEQSLGSKYSFPEEVLNFIGYYKINKAVKGMDIYKFNVTTLLLLTGIDNVYNLCLKISKNKLNIGNVNNDVKRLCKELLLVSRKPYSNQYIIDYM